MEKCLQLESNESRKEEREDFPYLASYYNSFKELIKKEVAQRESAREINAVLARESKDFFAQLMLNHLPEEVDGLMLEHSIYIRTGCKKDCENDHINIMDEKEIESKIESSRDIEE